MQQLLVLTLGLLAYIPASLCRVTTAEELTVLEGNSATVPCHYDPQYAGHVKYWCQGRTINFCSSLARTDEPRSAARSSSTSGGGEETNNKVDIFDDPVQQVFTVTMRDLKEADAGWYWCGVEVGNMWSADVTASVHITVLHDVSVVNSRVSGVEGDTVTVECQYSERYRQDEKKWCRSGDWSSCLVSDSEGTYQDAWVGLVDDRARGSFTVTIRGLRMRDAGWYFCAAGQRQKAVHVQVTPRPATTAAVSTTMPSSPPPSQPPASTTAVYLPLQPKNITMEPGDTQRRSVETVETVVICVSVMLLMGMAVLAARMWNQHKKEQRLRQTEELKARLTGYPGDVADLQGATVIFLNGDSQNAHML